MLELVKRLRVEQSVLVGNRFAFDHVPYGDFDLLAVKRDGNVLHAQNEGRHVSWCGVLANVFPDPVLQ